MPILPLARMVINLMYQPLPREIQVSNNHSYNHVTI